MFFIAYAFKGQVHVFAGQVKILSYSSCRPSAIFKYFCPLNISFGRVKETSEGDVSYTYPKHVIKECYPH